VRGSDDTGVTLLEVVMGMSIMSFVMVAFTAGLLSVVRAAGHGETMAVSRSQLNVAFDRLDRQIRYASGISLPGTAGGDSYVEFQTDGSGGALCTQLRLNATARRLEQRAWNDGATPGAAWSVLASGVSAAEPFRRENAGSGSGVQRLRFVLTTDLPPGSTGPAPQTDITFSALNTSPLTSSDQICAEGRPA
jgi:type II secretory pathway pseudopilin PulG